METQGEFKNKIQKEEEAREIPLDLRGSSDLRFFKKLINNFYVLKMPGAA